MYRYEITDNQWQAIEGLLPGKAPDCPQALPLLEGLKPAKVLADTAYDRDANRAYCAANASEVIIPSLANRCHWTTQATKTATR